MRAGDPREASLKRRRGAVRSSEDRAHTVRELEERSKQSLGVLTLRGWRFSRGRVRRLAETASGSSRPVEFGDGPGGVTSEVVSLALQGTVAHGWAWQGAATSRDGRTHAIPTCLWYRSTHHFPNQNDRCEVRSAPPRAGLQLWMECARATNTAPGAFLELEVPSGKCGD